ncbi:hypothetical protein ROT00_14705 [Agromyces mediolanus]|uniref:hypothetical protein n=1 Tax=Agromyces mediolanus TaxID=41986 RepID=UPI003836C424
MAVRRKIVGPGTEAPKASGWKRRAAVAALAVGALTGALVPAAAEPASAYYTSDAKDFEVLTHIQDRGWTQASGTRNQGLRLEAIQVRQLNDKRLCLRAHVANIGWQQQQCTSGRGSVITVGTTGRALAIEAVEVTRIGSYRLWAYAHIQNIGDQRAGVDVGSDRFTVGTTGRGLRMEGFLLNNA